MSHLKTLIRGCSLIPITFVGQAVPDIANGKMKIRPTTTQVRHSLTYRLEALRI